MPRQSVAWLLRLFLICGIVLGQEPAFKIDSGLLQRSHVEAGAPGDSGAQPALDAVAGYEDGHPIIDLLLHVPAELISIQLSNSGCLAAEVRVAVRLWEGGLGPAVRSWSKQETGKFNACGDPASALRFRGVVYQVRWRVERSGTYGAEVEIGVGSSGKAISHAIVDLESSSGTLQLLPVDRRPQTATPRDDWQPQLRPDRFESFWRTAVSGDPGNRRYRVGDKLSYRYTLGPDASQTERPRNFTARVLRKGELLSSVTANPRAGVIEGEVAIDSTMAPGPYLFGIVAGEPGAADASSHWIDFTVENDGWGSSQSKLAELSPATANGPAPVPVPSAISKELSTPAAVPFDLASTPEARLKTLSAALQRMGDAIEHISNYTCTENITRADFTGVPPRRRRMDRVWIEVAVVNGTEQFSWPGAEQFDADDPKKIIRRGSTTIGEFSALAPQIFAMPYVAFDAPEDDPFGDRRAIRFHYRTAEKGYTIRVDGKEAKVAHHGFFWAEPGSGKLIAVQVIVDQIPESIAISKVTNMLAFSSVGSSADLAYPASADLTAYYRSGLIVRHHIDFRNCRKYQGESKIMFHEASGDLPVSGQNPTRLTVPEGKVLDLSLDQAVVAATAAAGQSITATLVAPLDVGQLRVPAGSKVHGRLLRFNMDFESSLIDVAFDFFRIETGAGSLNLRGSLQSVHGRGILPRQPHGFILARGLTTVPAGMRFRWRTSR